MTRNSAYGVARKRERDLMRTLAKAVAVGFVPPESASLDDLRQLGYAAQLARGSVADPDRHLLEVVRFCRKAVAGESVPHVSARDRLQAEWGAPWHVDAGKLRTELPLHLSRALA
jgi:hypothetical protein